MEEADVLHVVDHAVEQWWRAVVATPECGEPAKQDLKDRPRAVRDGAPRARREPGVQSEAGSYAAFWRFLSRLIRPERRQRPPRPLRRLEK